MRNLGGPYQHIDESFLLYIDDLRESLYRAFKKNDPTLNSGTLTGAVQRTVDRLLLIRFLEDKLIEPESFVSEFGAKTTAWEDFISVCHKLDVKYKDVVFKRHFIDQQKFTAEAESLFAKICQDFSHPDSPYNFKDIPIQILGSIYERSLGKKVVETGGVYYTPDYIVKYMVTNTIGTLIEGKTPKEIARLRFADIACGCGSFLIGVLECLFDYHTLYYNKNPGEAEKDLCLLVDGNYILSLRQKQQILTNNIFGVDTDHQATEVTRLSLYLKMLEDDTGATANEIQVLSHEKNVLPDLGKNILCGNSLISTAFDFGLAFPQVFQQGGFDAIVGNPPYRTLLLGKKQDAEAVYVVDYFKTHYPNSSTYKLSLFSLFIERGAALLNKKGLLSYIVPNALNQATQFKPLRKFILHNFAIDTIYDLRYKVFKDAETGGNTIYIFSKEKQKPEFTLLTAQEESGFAHPETVLIRISDVESDPDHSFVIERGYKALLDKISQTNTQPLGRIARLYQGIITGDNKKFLSNRAADPNWKKILRGKDLQRYSIGFNENYVYYVPEELWSNTDPEMFDVPEKIISRQTSDRLIASIDQDRYFSLDSTHVIHLLTDTISLKYLLGIYNSSLFNFLYQNRVKESGRVFAQVKIVNLKPLPVRMIDKNSRGDQDLHDQLERLVGQLLDAKQLLRGVLRQEQLPQELSEQERSEDRLSEQELEYLERKIQGLDLQIDQLVYRLYNLDSNDIALVEAAKGG